MSSGLAALETLPPVILVGLGGMLGALSRYGVDVGLSGGPRSTFAVNVAGSFTLGVLVTTPVSAAALTTFGTGFCGAFTTFSSFAVSVAERAADGRWRDALRYATLTLLAALVGVALGGALGGSL
jgi:CrcB protein